ncbi:RLA class II histocompatibility antigen, DP alpha-1 chain-like [Pelmatolapia mariae]|uniref:RLA class II histocompatibility antigen, DP alpha-1 chain-like n=1 Tax=Pelmatolapia mariae TaxID=158779 RepID=UPI003211D3EC
MKMKVWVLLLVLCSVICVSADGLYEMNSVSGCSDTDGEDVLILDDEVVWYADFNKQKGVDSLPAFADHPSFEGKYEEAVASQLICRQNLKVARMAMKDFPKRHNAPDSVNIYTTLNMELGVQNTLICHVTGFYPAPVNITWTKNTKKVVEGSIFLLPSTRWRHSNKMRKRRGRNTIRLNYNWMEVEDKEKQALDEEEEKQQEHL